LMRQPWALGYLQGVAFAVIRSHGLIEDSHDGDMVRSSVQQAAFGRVASADVVHWSKRASAHPDYNTGAGHGMRDVLRGPDEPGLRLLDWLGERLGG
jgi:hypothetical protein